MKKTKKIYEYNKKEHDRILNQVIDSMKNNKMDFKKMKKGGVAKFLKDMTLYFEGDVETNLIIQIYDMILRGEIT